MSRLLVTFVGLVMFLASAPVFAGEKSDQKSQVISLYKNYRTSLKADDSEAALKFAEQMYALTPGAFGKTSKTHATATFNLAQINDFLKYYKVAAELYQQHIDILDELKAPKDESYLAKLGLLSMSYMKVANFEGAIKYGRKALDLAENLKVSDDILALYELKLGIFYAQSHGKGRWARQHIDKAVKLFFSVYGADNIKTALAIFWQAKLDMSFNQNHKPVEKLEHVLDVYNKELKAGDERILQVHALLVIAYDRIGEKDKSRQHRIDMASENPSVSVQKYAPIYKVAPIYPRKAQERGMSGYVVLGFDIDETGLVENVKVLESSNKMFEVAARKAARTFRYVPAIKDGKRVKTKGVTHKITFEMEPR